MDAIRFDGRVALVTGGARGLGRDYCMALAARGAKLVVNDLSAAMTRDVVEAIRNGGGEAIAAPGDVGTAEGGQQVVAAAQTHYGRLDILVSNAGILQTTRFEDMAVADVERLIRVNLLASFYVGQPAFRLMKSGGYGRIILVGSSSAMFGHPWHSAYAAAKGGMFGLSNVLALEGRAYGINSNVLMPTAVTPMNEAMGDAWLEDEGVAATVGRIDFGAAADRLTPANNTPLLLYLASEQNESTHGCYSSVAGRYARAQIAVNEGWRASDGKIATPEDIMAQWRLIQGDMQALEPMHVYEELLAVQQGTAARPG